MGNKAPKQDVQLIEVKNIELNKDYFYKYLYDKLKFRKYFQEEWGNKLGWKYLCEMILDSKKVKVIVTKRIMSGDYGFMILCSRTTRYIYRNNDFGLEYLIIEKPRKVNIVSDFNENQEHHTLSYNISNYDFVTFGTMNSDYKFEGICTCYHIKKNNVWTGTWTYTSNYNYIITGKQYKNNMLVFDGKFTSTGELVKGKFYSQGYVKYDGEYKNNEYSGYGIMYCNTSHDIMHKGYFKHNVFIGETYSV